MSGVGQVMHVLEAGTNRKFHEEIEIAKFRERTNENGNRAGTSRRRRSHRASTLEAEKPDDVVALLTNGFMPAEWPGHGYVGLLEDDAVRLIRTAESLTGPAMASKQLVHSRILLWDRDNTFIAETCSSPAFGLSFSVIDHGVGKYAITEV